MIGTISILVGLVAFGFFYWVIFRDFEDFCESVLAPRPSLLSTDEDESGTNQIARFKSGVWLFSSVATGVGTYLGLTWLFGN